MSTAEQLLSAEDFLALEGKPEFCELIRGAIVTMPPPGFRQGIICGQVYYLLRQFVDEQNLGRELPNDSGVVTQRNPDTVRGGDVAFYSFERLPRDVTPVGYPTAVPSLVFEVRSPHDVWSEIHEKVAEYLTAGVDAVCVMVPETSAAHLFYPDRPGEIFQAEDNLKLPAPLNGFEQPVSVFFEV